MAPTDKKSVIITFKPKDQRADTKKDKFEIVQSAVRDDLHRVDTGAVPRGGSLPATLPREAIALDVDAYEAPIVVVSLTDKEIASLKKNPNIQRVENDGKVYALGAGPRVDELLVEGQPSVLSETIPTGVAQVKAQAAWDSSRGKGIKVAVLDTGIDGTHPDLVANYKGAVSFVPGQPSANDPHSHGTHCAGTIAAAINGAGVVGVAPAAYLYAVKVLAANGSGDWSWLISGINWCISNGMRVLSMSLGADAAPAALGTMCQFAWNQGLLLIAAAGNSASPASTGPGNVTFPAKYPSVIAVSAIDGTNMIAGFSCRGPEVELSAPGVNVLSTLPGGGYGTKSGTSMACPHVAGAAALAWGSHRYQTNVVIRRLLASTSDNLGTPGRDPLFGYGRVDAEQAAFELSPPPVVPGIP